MERGELSHSAVATFFAGLVGASRYGGGDSRRLCQCRLSENVPSALGMAGVSGRCTENCFLLFSSSRDRARRRRRWIMEIIRCFRSRAISINDHLFIDAFVSRVLEIEGDFPLNFDIN